MKIARTLGLLLLSVWLIFTGLIPLLHLGFRGMHTAMAVLALVSGVLIALGRS